MPENTGGGWSLGQSIALELDIALSFAAQPEPPLGRGPAFEEVWALLGAEEREEYRRLLGEARPFRSVLEVLAILAGVVDEADYGRASLAMRALDPSSALEALLLRSPGLRASVELPKGGEASLLLDCYPAFLSQVYETAGLGTESLGGLRLQARRDMERALAIMGGGPDHEAFWHWLDRFYYGSYAAWRRGQEQGLEASLAEALRGLGSARSSTGRPAIDWLPEENPLRTRADLAGILDRGLSVHFCVEPFGIADIWLLEPGRLVLAISRPGPLFEAFRLRMVDLASRVSALADPSRLAILRMIRQVGAGNTDMAATLHLSRPTVSVHARILREAGLIRSRQEGRRTLHEIVPGELGLLFRDLMATLDLDPALDLEPRARDDKEQL